MDQLYNLSFIDFEIPYFHYSRKLTREVQSEVAGNVSSINFTDLARINEVVMERLGRSNDETRCQDIRDKLVRIEETKGSGRVKLSDFYQISIEDGEQFREHID